MGDPCDECHDTRRVVTQGDLTCMGCGLVLSAGEMVVDSRDMDFTTHQSYDFTTHQSYDGTTSLPRTAIGSSTAGAKDLKRTQAWQSSSEPHRRTAVAVDALRRTMDEALSRLTTGAAGAWPDRTWDMFTNVVRPKHGDKGTATIAVCAYFAARLLNKYCTEESLQVMFCVGRRRVRGGQEGRVRHAAGGADVPDDVGRRLP